MSEDCVEGPLSDVESMLAGKVDSLEGAMVSLCEIIQDLRRTRSDARGLFEVVTFAQRQGLNVDRLSEEVLTLLSVRMRLMVRLSPEARAEREAKTQETRDEHAPILLPIRHA